MIHVPVLLSEVIQYINLKPNKNYIDCTLGGGGHAQAILKRIAPWGKLLAVEADIDSLNLAKNRLKVFGKRIIYCHNNFANLKNIIYEHKFNRIFGILFDLGLSSYLLDEAGRGFSFQKDEPLDMRYGIGNSKFQIPNSKQIPKSKIQTQKFNAYKAVNEYPEWKLTRVLKEYGEERYAKQIAKKICQERKQKPIKTTFDLVEIIKKSVPKNYERNRISPATRTFQSLRIEVNQELENLKKALPQASEVLEPGGRIVCLSYHSLEDRIVKQFFIQESKDCLCPKELPECRCGHKARLKIITKKPIMPSPEEIKQNPRARSAKMRTAEKI